MSEFICEKCGKPFQNNEDLVRHTRFEEGKERSKLEDNLQYYNVYDIEKTANLVIDKKH